jgi:hypothetical protein
MRLVLTNLTYTAGGKFDLKPFSDFADRLGDPG